MSDSKLLVECYESLQIVVATMLSAAQAKSEMEFPMPCNTNPTMRHSVTAFGLSIHGICKIALYQCILTCLQTKDKAHNITCRMDDIIWPILYGFLYPWKSFFYFILYNSCIIRHKRCSVCSLRVDS